MYLIKDEPWFELGIVIKEEAFRAAVYVVSGGSTEVFKYLALRLWFHMTF